MNSSLKMQSLFAGILSNKINEERLLQKDKQVKKITQKKFDANQFNTEYA